VILIRSLTPWLFALFMLASCATVNPNLPAITAEPTGDHYDGRIVWRDLLTTTPEETREFYAALFGWEFENPGIDLGFGQPDTYQLIRHEGRLIGGLVDANMMRRDVNISQWVTVMSVGDIDAAVDRVAREGGEVLTPPTAVGSRGTIAVITGPDGALLGLVETLNGDPPEAEPEYNEWLWDELWTDDIDGSAAFFGRVAGLRLNTRLAAEADYRVLEAGGRPRAGLMPMPFEGEHPVWVNYVRVADPAAIVARVESLGGRVLVDVQERSVGGRAALIAGPSGAGVALQTWPLD
jgi:predicted enzyme related to lactoylglutathione lyase